jgi:hypothetical protein
MTIGGKLSISFSSMALGVNIFHFNILSNLFIALPVYLHRLKQINA